MSEEKRDFTLDDSPNQIKQTGSWLRENESNYYVPSIEELYVGFYHEYLRDGNWYKHSLGSGKADFEEAIESLTKGQIRVKCLDREDIEAEGWTLSSESPGLGENILMFSRPEKDGRVLVFGDGRKKELPNVTLWERYYDRLFQGTIRNRSELRRIMKMVGIR